MLGEPICVSTLSSHCRGPFRCSSIQQGVLVTVCLLQDTGKGTGRDGGGGAGPQGSPSQGPALPARLGSCWVSCPQSSLWSSVPARFLAAAFIEETPTALLHHPPPVAGGQDSNPVLMHGDQHSTGYTTVWPSVF